MTPTGHSSLRHWLMFCGLGLIWGSSFLWIKVALGNDGEPFLGIAAPAGAVVFAPLVLVAIRLTLAAAGLTVIATNRRIPIPRDRRTLGGFAFMGVFYAAIPFVLITWSETRIDSGMAAILNGTVPLFTIVIAHLWLSDDRMTVPRVAGLAIGFAGVAVLVTANASSAGGSLLGFVAALTAAVSYAVSSTFARRHLQSVSPVAQALSTMVVGDVVVIVAILASGRPIAFPDHALPWLAAIWLGALGTCAAYLLYFTLIKAWGPTRASLVTYLFPVVGVALGVSILGEELSWRLVLGTALVVSGIAVVNLVRPPGGVTDRASHIRDHPPSAGARATQPRRPRS